MPHYISALLELILSITCYYYGALFMTRRYDLLTGGYMIIAFTAFIGVLDMIGQATFTELHSLATGVSRLAGMLSIGIGLIFILLRYRPHPWLSISVLTLSMIASYVLYKHDKPLLEWLCLAVGVVFLLTLVVLSVRLATSVRRREAMAAVSAVVLFGYIAVFHKSMPAGYLLRPVDVVHICLILAYPAVYYAAMGYESMDN